MVRNMKFPSIFPHNSHTYRVGDIPLRRIGSPTDAGRAILAVVSPLFSYVTGHVSETILRHENDTNNPVCRQSWYVRSMTFS
jgi:NAD(P)-dependent dehydrogenase (short-subunit alcohol dehydrogenase family)